MPLSHIKPETYAQQLKDKVDRISTLFAEHFFDTGFETGSEASSNIMPLDVYPSPPLHFRMRAEFRLWHDDNDLFYVMFKKDDPKTPCRIDDFPIGSTTINRLMPQLLEHIKEQPLLRRRLFQVEFLSTLAGECLITLIYHKALDDTWHEQALQLQQQLGAVIIGRSKKQKRVLERDYVTETLTVNNRPYRYQQIEASFTQPNAAVCQQMLEWACDASVGSEGDLLELYCGNGNFTIPLAQNFRKVLATEISKPSVRSAMFNAELNAVDNIQILRMSSEEFTAAMNKEREFRRLKDVHLDSYQLDTLFVDPPRAGLDDKTVILAQKFKRIIYISCNPDTLKHNLDALCKTHKLTKLALFDQFPYTHHAECGAILEKI